jgi:hypothetical protein
MPRLFSLLAVVAFATLVSRVSGATSDAKINVGAATIDVTFAAPSDEAQRQVLLDWVTASARAVALYYGEFPVPHAELRISTFSGRGVRDGRASGWRGPRIVISVGTANSSRDFATDWMLTHEMIHLAFPSVAERHHWIEEGISVYVEPIARARAGLISAEDAWKDLVEGVPQGLPEPGDRGLDNTPTWGRTYWGGALFCLLADVEIRKRTKSAKGLQDALRAIQRAGGTITNEWDLQRAFEIGDRATGVPVLRELYDKMSAVPYTPDLGALWTELGIERRGSRVVFNDRAPLAAVREAIDPARKPAAIGAGAQ